MNGNLLFEIDYGNDRIIEIIVKYRGNIDRIANEVGASAEVLSESFAILKISTGEIKRLSQFQEIIYIELPKLLRLFLENEKEASCISYESKNIGNLSGNGVLIGIIDSGINEGVSFYNKVKYKLDLNNNPDTSHGTMVATIVNSIAPEADIAFVSIGRNDFFASDTDIMRGIKFIVDSAGLSPFVINISYGTNSGPHNGTTLFEEYIDEICESYRCSIVVAAGNEGDKARHYSNGLSNNNSNEIEFYIDNAQPFVELELWKNFVDRFSYTIISPQGDSSGIISSNVSETDFILGNNKIYFIFNEPSAYRIDEEVYIRIEGNDVVSSGIWKLIVRGLNVVEGSYNIWTQGSEFLQPDIFTTITLPSTANRAITVGAYNSQNNGNAPFSGRGYTTLGNIKPDIVAPGVNVNVNNSTYNGTSTAAPFVTGSCALLMEWGIVKNNDRNMYGERLKAYLRLGANREVGVYPNRISGYGSLCFEKTYSRLNSISIQALNTDVYSNGYRDVIFRNSRDFQSILDINNISYCSIDNNRFVIAYINSELLLSQIANANIPLRYTDTILFGLMDEAYNNAADITRVQLPPLSLRGRGVAVGFVDTGINYRNNELLYENGDSKIHCIWDMTIENENSEDVCFGRVFTNEELTTGIANTNDTVGHGTQMAIAACGNSGAAPDSTIIAVKLKTAKEYMYDENFIDKNTPAYSEADIMLGIDFIVREAQKLNMPLVLVLGLGTNQGAHDGSTYIEEYFESLGNTSGIIVVTPSGNEALSRHHTAFNISGDNGYYDIEINVAENVKGFNMWIWNTILDRIDIGIISPLGEEINKITSSNDFRNEYSFFQSDSRVEVLFNLPVFQTVDQKTTLRFFTPIEGIWRVRVYGSSNYSRINAWLPITPFIGNRVTFVNYDVSVTVVVPSTANNTLVTGAFNTNDNIISPSSGRGPTRLGVLRPFILSPSNGTSSIASAVAAGAGALLLEWGIVKGNLPNINSVTATALFANGAVQSSSEIYPNNISGFGLLNLYNVFKNL